MNLQLRVGVGSALNAVDFLLCSNRSVSGGGDMRRASLDIRPDTNNNLATSGPPPIPKIIT
jgi:hypothetical protein